MRIAYIHALSGNREKAEEILQELTKDSSNDISCYNQALVYTALGDKDNAFTWLEKSFENKEFIMGLIFIKADPEWDSLHSDPRFKELTDKIGLP